MLPRHVSELMDEAGAVRLRRLIGRGRGRAGVGGAGRLLLASGPGWRRVSFLRRPPRFAVIAVGPGSVGVMHIR
ncbi:MAG: hypothetical protein JO252_19240 [Planctomycetaceae bacterium]|nr:hypothetical protein [Planctomycetaceae bacterium]MBV8316095.1 hypothetical protein [Planctomycetaceae bacterium]MBV8609001.1 hypothetical protein [Singulisphaera sp.]